MIGDIIDEKLVVTFHVVLVQLHLVRVMWVELHRVLPGLGEEEASISLLSSRLVRKEFNT